MAASPHALDAVSHEQFADNVQGVQRRGPRGFLVQDNLADDGLFHLPTVDLIDHEDEPHKAASQFVYSDHFCCKGIRNNKGLHNRNPALNVHYCASIPSYGCLKNSSDRLCRNQPTGWSNHNVRVLTSHLIRHWYYKSIIGCIAKFVTRMQCICNKSYSFAGNHSGREVAA